MTPLSVVQALRARLDAALQQLEANEIAVLRVDVVQPDDEPERDWIGFAASLAPRTSSRHCAAGSGAMPPASQPQECCQ
ncbi:hypothetical protein [Streptomyces sp. SP2-10]|uniref:hypothetical protein n=1 Tax=Streptomyces sp. SP2-10 TaxID=2873385 RepID=UPI00223C2A5F|nr:hypothetical protein [Streptomyces sp. SP2-10]